MKKITVLFLIFCVLLSCQKKKPQVFKDYKKPELSVVKNHAKPDNLDALAEPKIEEWKEYNNLSIFLKRFDKITPNQALSSAIELKDLVKKIKDSLKPKLLDNNAFKARINVLQNEALRLTDMSYISSIKADEVNNQVTKILDVYGSINDKINAIYAQKRFEEVVKIGIDFETISEVKKPLKETKKERKKPILKKELLNKKPLEKSMVLKKKLTPKKQF